MAPLREPGKLLRRTGNITLLALVILFMLCIAFSWGTRNSILRLPFLAGSLRRGAENQKALVDVTPWQTAQALRALAGTAEEIEYAREAERLADHEVDQAFASALREATMQVQRFTPTGRALELSKRVDELQQLVDQDKAQLDRLSAAVAAPAPAAKSRAAGRQPAAPQPDDADVEIAKAQLQLDSDQLEDAEQDLAKASGDNRARIQSEHATREAAMTKYESDMQASGQVAVVTVSRAGTLAGRLAAWGRQRTRLQLLEQAIQQVQADVRNLSQERSALEAQANAEKDASASGADDRARRLARIRDRSAERQLLSIYSDRIQTHQDLAAVYSKWTDQVLRQRRVVQHLILQSLAVIIFILICMILGARLVRRLMARPALDRRQNQTLRMILELSVQAVGIVIILLVIFGVPRETPTILGLATAALTIALQDYIVSFLGWFRLVGRRGIRVGDWVEINNVSGEVIEVGLMTTALLETRNGGYRTGRTITFMNSFAIRGQFFNFSTSGHWMWDELTVPLPASIDGQAAVKQVLEAVNAETGQGARLAEQEWKRGAPRDEPVEFRADPVVNLRPSGSGVDIEIRYVTRAWECVEVRNRLYNRIIELLHQRAPEPQPAPQPEPQTAS
ncbi:MAG TPA: mechanosensitive ion channel domain-containing protein [Terracidiphilus sp.]|nr:mechanosensitive ion channel domain-containing protein [Terracidiphilus sp.]